MIRETIITTTGADGQPLVAPMGVTVEASGDGERFILAPFRPSRTLDNLLAYRCAVVNHTDDVRIFAGCISGRRCDWPTVPAERIDAPRLADCLSHEEIVVAEVEDDPVRPRFHCRTVHAATHGRFRGHNRAQAAVIEAAILVSRLHMLPADKIEREVGYLSIAIGKTAGPQELEAWGWLMERISAHRKGEES
ncbi:DUF447 domain-containing protein (plasmid) [Azospirillum humicireducens]|uniref:DUF447 domain-containing protein n=1 Tax=Azospirillum humicireducens TaxID=1226968 RepID=A0A2R4VXT3_9PROT|nr:DUF447 domain-containing protein [Azospirillum humicireducens]AWB09276.1 DUF447 domain-containing protein [Azospirillum humicireducens]